MTIWPIVVCFFDSELVFFSLFSLKGKEANVTIVFRGYVKGNDETPQGF
jgi:hypothetical protein